MEVSTSYCTPAVNFKYGSFHDSDASMRDDDDDVDLFGMGGNSYNSQGYYVDGPSHIDSDGSCGEEDEETSSGSNEEEPMEFGGGEEEDFEMESGTSMTEELVDEDEEEEDEEDNDEWTNQKRTDNQNSVAYYAAMEMLRIRFPFQSISIRISDFCCLQEKEFPRYQSTGIYPDDEIAATQGGYAVYGQI
uniref:Ubiquitin-like domain-containing protein n=2 Tax=Caenorhabditis tropicalis TaxID=1561998 RepID=A0A1I7UR30_9PELO